MKFIPREIKENVNISKISPVREFFILLGGILGLLLVTYLVLGFALDILIDRMPLRLEQKLGIFFSNKFHFNKHSCPLEIKAQEIIDEFAQYIPESSFRFTVHIVDSKEVNALALPGGHILVYMGLLKEIETENEFAMVLAHELGHFVHRDHLRGLGRGLVSTIISSFVFGIDSEVTEFLMRILLTTDRRFSRRQEAAADKFALELLYKKYGHVTGATDFFEHTKEKIKMPGFIKFFSTHPLHPDRIDLLKREIDKKGYGIKEKTPLIQK